MALDVLQYTPLPLIGEILPDPSGPISEEMVRVFQRGERGRKDGLIRICWRWSRGVEDMMKEVVQRAL
jgi:hypothetical protein